jgi:hypothetical protein
MRDIYLDRKEFELKYDPGRPSSVMKPLNHPELFINDKITRVHTFPENFKLNVPTYVCFECSLILTNCGHDGFWLVMDDDKNTIDLPGGFVTEEDWAYASQSPYYVIYSAILRSMIASHPVLREEEPYNPLLQLSEIPTITELSDIMNFVIRRYDLETADMVDSLYYLYRYPNYETVTPYGYVSSVEEEIPHMHIFVIREVTSPIADLPPFVRNSNGHLIWYSRYEHHLNFRTSSDRRILLSSQYENDIRVSTTGLMVLNAIFSEENQFGKLDIY